MRVFKKLMVLVLMIVISVIAYACTGPSGVQGLTGQPGPAGPAGANGVGVTGASINSNGHLTLTLSNGQTIDAGIVSASQNIAATLPSFADLVSAANPSVVQIDITATVRAGRRTVQQQGSGSGWIMDSNGTIVTNNHVVAGATNITVTTSDGKTFPAQVINTDSVNDLALIKINASQLKSIKIGDASRLRAGDWVLAIGNPLGEGITATQGIVSRLGVTVPVSATQNYNNLIETTAPINPGNSGGPLVNLSGEVVGITALEADGVQGMGYAINMVDALPIIQKLSK
jgi:serine protease Do